MWYFWQLFKHAHARVSMASVLFPEFPMARWLAKYFQQMLEKGAQLENNAIDFIGDALSKRIQGD
jgi:hypothetical protein